MSSGSANGEWLASDAGARPNMYPRKYAVIGCEMGRGSRAARITAGRTVHTSMKLDSAPRRNKPNIVFIN